MTAEIVTFEILRHRLWMINEQMAKVIKLISGSPVVYDTNDFAVGLFDSKGNQILVSCHMTNLGASLQDCTKYILNSHQGHINEGDVFYTNDPWVGVVHYNDFASIEPVFWKGQIVAFTGVVMHELDVGGPSIINTKATEAFAEAPCFPPIKLVERGSLRVDIEHMLLRNTRTPGLVGLDMRARIAAHNMARERILEIVRQHGEDTLAEVLRRIKDFAKESIKDKLRRLPNGIWREESYIDHDGFQNKLYKVALTMTKEGEKLTFDFSPCARQAAGPINLAPPGLRGAVITGILPMMCYDSTWSTAAVFETVEIKAEEGSILSAAYPAAIGVATITAQMTAGSLVKSCIGKMYCCSKNYRDEVQSGGATSAQVHWVSGQVRGKHITSLFVPSAMGYGARTWKDGIDSAGPTGNPGRAATGIEVTERNAPILMLYYRQDFDTVGAGTYRGGMGTHWAWISHKNEGPLKAYNYLTGVNHPTVKALYGGYVPSSAAYLVLRDSNIKALFSGGIIPTHHTQISCREIEVQEAKGETDLDYTDVMVGFSPGGGGYGDPLERSPELVANDISQGWCSLATAKKIYGVVMLENGTIDLEATAEQRELLRRKRIDTGNPSNGDMYNKDRQIQANRSSLLTIGDCLTVIQSEKEHFVSCARCDYIFSSLDENYKLGALQYETAMEELSPLNKWAPKADHIVVKHFCCPKCGLAVGCEVNRREDPPLFDTLITRPGAMSHGMLND